MMNAPYTKCSWCGEAYQYDCECDEFESNDGGELPVEIVELPGYTPKQFLHVTRCRCGGILAVTTDEENGSEVLTNGQGDMTL